MSDRRLFRTPIAIGMLCGALAGGLGLVSMFLTANHIVISRQHILLDWLQLNLLIALAARIAGGNWRYFFRLQIFFVALMIFTYILPPYLSASTVLAGLSIQYYRYYWMTWYIVAKLGVGILLGRTLARAYDREDLLGAGLRWGALGSLARIAVTFSPFLSDRASRESTAMIAMLSALAFVVQGVVAAVPFERTMKSETVA